MNTKDMIRCTCGCEPVWTEVTAVNGLVDVTLTCTNCGISFHSSRSAIAYEWNKAAGRRAFAELQRVRHVLYILGTLHEYCHNLIPEYNTIVEGIRKYGLNYTHDKAEERTLDEIDGILDELIEIGPDKKPIARKALNAMLKSLVEVRKQD